MTDDSRPVRTGDASRPTSAGAPPSADGGATVTDLTVAPADLATASAGPPAASADLATGSAEAASPVRIPRTAAVIPAAGRGVRLGPGAPKALRVLSGVPMLVHAARALAASRAVQLIVVVAPPDGAPEVKSLLDAHALPERADVVVVPGGDTRQESVKLGLDVLPPDIEIVLVHDAARPLVPVETVDAVIEAVREGAPAVVPALPLADTVKEVGPCGPDEPEPVVATPDRARLRAVQTPQGFSHATLVRAHETVEVSGEGATDDAGMVERLGEPVVLVPGHEEAFKVTRPLDLVLAEAVLARRRAKDEF